MPYLGLARLAIMAGHTDLVEEAMQLANDGVDLLQQVARIHRGGRGRRQRRV